jgi:hypothetical protein
VCMRIGLLVETRRQSWQEEDREPLEKMWANKPGCFESGGVRETIVII